MATKKEQAQELFDLATDGYQSVAARLENWTKLQALKKSSKMSFSKLLDMPEAGVTSLEVSMEKLAQTLAKGPFEEEPAADPLEEEPAADPLDEQPAEEPKTNLTSLVHELLTETEMSYSAIVEAVKAKFPEAKTTNRSVASVACELRKDGVAVPSRRVKKKG